MKISIIGIGRLGSALALALSRKGHTIENLVPRNPETAVKISGLISPPPRIMASGDFGAITSDIVLIATQDPEIGLVAGDLSERLTALPCVFHTSGSLSSEILGGLERKGCRTGSLHPLVSVSDPILGAERFAGAYFCVEGDAEAVAIAERIVADLGGKSFSIESDKKALYHASAVTACGHLVTLIDVAIEMLETCGLDSDRAREVLLPLIKSTVDNLVQQTPGEALTGTFARGDAATVERHIAAIVDLDSPEILEVYVKLGERSADLAEQLSGDAEKFARLREKLSLAKRNLKC